MSERSVATSDPENTSYAKAPAIPATAAIFLIGQPSAKAGESARSARVSQKKTPAASTMWRPEIDTMW